MNSKLTKEFFRVDANFPQMVFQAGPIPGAFMESDVLTSRSGFDFIGSICRLDNATEIIAINISSHDLKCSREDAADFSFRSSVSFSDYLSFLEADGPENGWLYSRPRVGYIPDTRRWIIYSEPENDLAYLAFLDPILMEKVRRLKASSDLHWCDGRDVSSDLLQDLDPSWRRKLLQTYNCEASEDR